MSWHGSHAGHLSHKLFSFNFGVQVDLPVSLVVANIGCMQHPLIEVTEIELLACSLLQTGSVCGHTSILLLVMLLLPCC